MKYLSYEEYAEMGGTLDETAFTDLEYEARAYINWVTFNRLTRETVIPEEVKECEYHILKLLQNKLELLNMPVSGDNGEVVTTGAGIESQSNDGVSVSYHEISAKDLMSKYEDEVDASIQRYLQGVRNSLGHRLLYRGLYPNEP